MTSAGFEWSTMYCEALAALLGVERHPDETGLGEPENHRQRFHAVAHHHRDMLAGLQATGAQPGRQR